MPTIKSIGSAAGRDFPNITAWLAAFSPGGWVGQCYNDSEFSESVNFSGQATSAADYITLECAPGQGFRDNANAQTNALRYNAANGVALNSNVGYGSTISIGEDYVSIIGLQIQQKAINGGVAFYNNTLGTGNCVFDGLIIEQLGVNAGIAQTRNGLYRNCLFINRTSANCPGIYLSYSGPTFANCLIVRPSNFTANSYGFDNAGSGGATIKNCGAFGFSGFANVGSFSGSNNASDQTIGFGTSNQASLTYASQFQSVTDSTRDFRLKAGSALIDAGATDTTDIPAAVDIVGTPRPQGAAWDIGHWEYVSGGGTQNITVAQAALTFAGFALGPNAKSQITISQAPLKFVGFALGANAKTQAAISRASLQFTGAPLLANAKSMMSVAQGRLALAGQALAANARSMLAVANAPLVFAGRAITITGTVSMQVAQAVMRFTGQSLMQLPIMERLLTLLGVGQ